MQFRKANHKAPHPDALTLEKGEEEGKQKGKKEVGKKSGEREREREREKGGKKGKETAVSNQSPRMVGTSLFSGTAAARLCRINDSQMLTRVCFFWKKAQIPT